MLLLTYPGATWAGDDLPPDALVPPELRPAFHTKAVSFPRDYHATAMERIAARLGPPACLPQQQQAQPAALAVKADQGPSPLPSIAAASNSRSAPITAMRAPAFNRAASVAAITEAAAHAPTMTTTMMMMSRSAMLPPARRAPRPSPLRPAGSSHSAAHLAAAAAHRSVAFDVQRELAEQEKERALEGKA